MEPTQTAKYASALSALGTLPPDAPQGVLDIGSNSVRLVGYSGSARTPLPIYNERAFCRLGDSVAQTGRIEGGPRKLALQTFSRFCAIAEQLGIQNIAAFATAAVRDAENRDAFIAEAQSVLGHDIRVLSGEEEAILSADGVMLGIPGADGIVADLGGGSLELARVYNNQVHHWVSLPLGVLALQQACMGELEKMAVIVEDALAQLPWLADGQGLPVYIVGGTWRALAKLHMQKTNYPLEVLHQYDVSPSEIEDFCSFIGDTSIKARRLLATASGNRRESMPAASLVLRKLLLAVRPSRTIISANGVREGLLYSDLKARYRRLDPLLMGCEEMAARQCKAEAYGHELAVWTENLYKRARPEQFTRVQLERLRRAGCLISDLAWASHSSFRAETVTQTVLTAPFSGVSHSERVFMARSLAFRHELRNEKMDYKRLNLTAQDDRLARALGLSLRLAHSLSASLPGVLPRTKLMAGRKKLKLTIAPEMQTLMAPIIEKRLQALAETLDLQPKVRLKDLA